MVDTVIYSAIGTSSSEWVLQSVVVSVIKDVAHLTFVVDIVVVDIVVAVVVVVHFVARESEIKVNCKRNDFSNGDIFRSDYRKNFSYKFEHQRRHLS